MSEGKAKHYKALLLLVIVVLLSLQPLTQSQVTASRAGAAQSKSSDSPETTDTLLSKLAEEPNLGIVYIDDGSGEGTVVDQTPNTVVRQIVALGSPAIPILIAHLDDKRSTSALYKGGKYRNDPVRVPLGFVVLDILMQISKDTGALYVNGHKHCEFDGMGACIKARYYAKPDVFLSRDPSSEKKVENLKAAWAAAYHRGVVKFEKPDWIS